ncbi:MAG: GSCFA domain-containing protein, partial [bacterium]|nr:GSCFA domain-containing protein [bacterium]
MAIKNLKYYLNLRRGTGAKWAKRSTEIKAKKQPILSADSSVFTMGSCFARVLADELKNLKLKGGSHGEWAYFYDTKSIRQEI